MLQSIGLLYVLFLWPLFQAPLVDYFGYGITTKIILLFFFIPVIESISFMIRRGSISASIYSAYFLAFFIFVLVHLLYHYENIQYFEKYYIVLTLFPIGALFISIPVGLSEKTLKIGAGIISILYAYELVKVLSLGGLMDGQRAVMEGATSGAVNYITIASLMLLLFSLVYNKKFVIISFAILLSALFITKSRGGFVTSAMILMFYIFITHDLNRFKKFFVFFLSFIILVSAFYVLGLSERFLMSPVTDYENPLGRINIIYDFFIRFLDNPLMGAGVATSFHLRYDPHNMLLEMLLEGGVLLFVAFLPIVYEIKNYDLYRSYNKSAFLVYLCFITLFVQGMFSGSFFVNSIFIITYFYLIRIKLRILKNRSGFKIQAS